ncbi:acyl-CoA-binding protein [Lutimonas sp.]|uniref:acyl-CoA-binding protein n=1 Tax=Lutimonas sp. TaxID=1872403 RepID=UPI003D9BBE6D
MKDLDRRFNNAFEIASAMTEKLPADVMLQFYSYYKHATNENAVVRPSGNNIVRNAFKLNAYFQIANITPDEAKKQYIALVEKYTGEKIK